MKIDRAGWTHFLPFTLPFRISNTGRPFTAGECPSLICLNRNRVNGSSLPCAMIRKIFDLAPLLLVAACDQSGGPFIKSDGPRVEYRPEEAGTVDHALCLLGFSAVPVQKVDPGHHLIKASINGQVGNFDLDTGADVTVINASQAERFGLSPGGGLRDLGGTLLGGASGNARQVAPDSFKVGPITVRQSRVVTADLSQLLTALGEISGSEVSGIIGQDVLNEHRAIIDVARPMLYLVEEDRDPAPVPAARCSAANNKGSD